MARSPRTDHAPGVVHIAFDACDAGLVEELAAAGALPSFARLLAEGRSVDTIAPYGTFVGSSWMTIATGTEVGTHGFFNWLTLDPRTYELEGTTPRDVVPRPYWLHAAEAGARVAVVDVPHAGLPEHLDGVLLKEWGAHDRHDGTASYPPSLLEELDATLGRHPVGGATLPGGSEAFAPCDYLHRADRLRTVDEERRLLDDLLHGIDAKLAATLRVLDQEPWDLFTVAFGEGHCVGHQLWHVHDASHPRHDPAVLTMLGDPVVRVYQRLDHALGTLLARCGPTTNVLVQLNHGMGPHYDGDHLLDELLLRIDRNLAGRFVPGWRTGAARAVLDHLPAPAARVGRRAIAGVVRHRADRHPPAVAGRTGPRPDRRVLQVPGNTTVGALRLNLRGREHAGAVAPGREEAELRRAIADALLQVVDIDTGRPLVRAVVDAEEVLARHDGDRFPDLFVEWERASLVERVWSPRTGTVVVPYTHWRTGDHVDRGLVDVPLPGTEGVAQADLLGRSGRVRHGGRGPLRAMVRPSGGARAAARRQPAEPVAAGAAAHSMATARRVDDLARLATSLQQRIDDTDRTAHDLWRSGRPWPGSPGRSPPPSRSSRSSPPPTSAPGRWRAPSTPSSPSATGSGSCSWSTTVGRARSRWSPPPGTTASACSRCPTAARRRPATPRSPWRRAR
jgi:predicted AlkP superfamily phosphohydrolase/phosphomutase